MNGDGLGSATSAIAERFWQSPFAGDSMEAMVNQRSGEAEVTVVERPSMPGDLRHDSYPVADSWRGLTLPQSCLADLSPVAFVLEWLAALQKGKGMVTSPLSTWCLDLLIVHEMNLSSTSIICRSGAFDQA